MVCAPLPIFIFLIVPRNLGGGDDYFEIPSTIISFISGGIDEKQPRTIKKFSAEA